MTQKEKIKDLEHCIELMNDGQSELVKQLEHFRNMASGYKGRNAQFQEEVKKLKEQVEHYKALDKEGDEINESRIAMIEEKELVIRGLQEQVNRLANKNAKLVNEVDAMKQELDYFYNKKPWYKRIF